MTNLRTVQKDAEFSKSQKSRKHGDGIKTTQKPSYCVCMG